MTRIRPVLKNAREIADSLQSVKNLRTVWEHWDRVSSPPNIKSHLPDLSGGALEYALFHLICCDRQCRADLGLAISRSEYQGAFPSHARIVAAACEHQVVRSTRFSETATTTERIGDYIVIQAIGSGAIGEVYEVRHSGRKTTEALKILIAQKLDHTEAFLHDLDVTCRLAHPGIVPIRQHGIHEGRPYYTMPKADRSLAGELIDQIILPINHAVQVTIEICEAMQYAHAQSVTHRDLKPANVLRMPTGKYVIADFDSARDEDRTEGISASRVPLGTPGFAAPELSEAGSSSAPLFPVGTWSDVYSIGATLYKALAGRTPRLEMRTPTMKSQRGLPIVPLRKHNSDVPRDLETICAKCLSDEIEDRYKDAGELLEDLVAFRDGNPIKGKRPTLLQSVRRSVKKHATTTAVAITMICSVCLAVFLLFLQHSGNERRSAIEQIKSAEFHEIAQITKRLDGDLGKETIYRLLQVHGLPDAQKARLGLAAVVLNVEDGLDVLMSVADAVPIGSLETVCNIVGMHSRSAKPIRALPSCLHEFAILSAADNSHPALTDNSDLIATKIVESSFYEYRILGNVFARIQSQLAPSLIEFALSEGSPDSARRKAFELAVDYGHNDNAILFQAIAGATDEQLTAVLTSLGESPDLREYLLHVFNDAPPPPVPVRRMESGVMSDDWSICIGVEDKEFRQFLQTARTGGQGPASVRIFSAKNADLYSGICGRSARGQEWQQGTREEILEIDLQRKREGLTPVDLGLSVTEEDIQQFSVVWARAEETKLIIDADIAEVSAVESELDNDEWQNWKSVALYDAGNTRVRRFSSSGIISRGTARQEGLNGCWDVVSRRFGELIPVDIQLVRCRPFKTPDDHLRILKDRLAGSENDLFQQLELDLLSGDVAAAEARVMAAATDTSSELQLFALLIALGSGNDADVKEALAEYLQGEVDPVSRRLIPVIVHAAQGGPAQTDQAIRESLAESADPYSGFQNCAKFCGFAASLLPTFREKLHEIAERLVVEIDGPGITDPSSWAYLPSLYEFRDRDLVRQILKRHVFENQINLMWEQQTGKDATMLHSGNTDEHLQKCSELLSSGWYPVRITSDGAHAYSIWHKKILSIEERIREAKKKANVVVALLALGHVDRFLEVLAEDFSDRTLQTEVICHACIPRRGLETAAGLLNSVRSTERATGGLLQILGLNWEKLSTPTQAEILSYVQSVVREEHSAFEVACAEWVSKKIGAKDYQSPTTVAGCLTDAFGTRFRVLGPAEFTKGAARGDIRAGALEEQSHTRLNYRFAISTTPVTLSQWSLFSAEVEQEINLPSNPEVRAVCRTPDSPMVGVTYYDAAAYCNWLTLKCGLTEDQCCYRPNAQGRYAAGMTVKPDAKFLQGYRLPTSAEFEFAARAASVCTYSFGWNREHAGKFAVFSDNSSNRLAPTHLRLPNKYGLFDMCGNAMSWCQNLPLEEGMHNEVVAESDRREVRSCAFNEQETNVRCSSRRNAFPRTRQIDIGFRVAKSIPD